MRPVVTDGIDQIIFNNNKYFSEADPDLWFRSEEKDYNFEEWSSYAQDFDSLSGQHKLIDTERSFETYLSSIGINPTIDSFVKEIKKQSKLNWRQDFTARVINEYVREGYGSISCPNKGSTYFPLIN